VSVGGRWLRERRALATLPAARAGAPNVLLIILDTVRSLDLSLYGYERPTTPSLSRLASTGVTFDRAVSAAPWTVLSHATLFTGQLRDVHHADWYSRLDPSVPTLAAIFRQQGYRTGGFSANEVHAGWEFGFARDFIHFEDHDISLAEVVDATTLGKFTSDHVRVRRLLDNWDLLGRTDADEINAKALGWLHRSGDRPYFVFLNYFDAHTPRMPPEPFARQFGASRPAASLRSRLSGLIFPSPKQQKSKNAYDAAIAYIDDRIGQLLDSLGREGLLENTLVVVTADHGELLGEHHLQGHANSLYFPTLHVPLLLSMPGTIPANQRIEAPATLRDVAATILDLAGVHAGPGVPGASLSRFWRDTTGVMETPIISEITGLPNLGTKTPVGRGDMVSLVRDSLHYIRNGDGVEELYNIRSDLTESIPLGPEFAAELASMRRVVDSVYVPYHKRAEH
jgi:arylsulfatase A-like enzyme